jgi:hypothetical protein
MHWCTMSPGQAAYVFQIRQFNISGKGPYHPTDVELSGSGTGKNWHALGRFHVTLTPQVGPNAYMFVAPKNICGNARIAVGIIMVVGNDKITWGNAGLVTVNGC